ncbi:alkaline phosphatase family protein [Belliella sp. DSM 107340]|uniref:Alkaline phosphatase family protein n=1 Tax=Belliella calami TaxID=2923436 RepID=A0ABS9UNX6_9BACT|nr:alkaline phosphatase family protein [Belliella calami]MCH7398336.1 alkaline phosphatase family protein [Belliella calami]
MKKTILLGLNELNFEFINYYINEGSLKNFKKLFNENQIVETKSEDKYHLLEPWIQWVTVTTGKSFDEHKVFRLGDIVDRKDLTQIFEAIEEKGYTVGAVSPFNVDNRLVKPVFFAPDPWTKTKPIGNKIFVGLSDAVSQAVNDNAHGKLTKKSILALVKGLGKYTSPKDYAYYMNKISKLKTQIGVRAIILDKLLSDTFIKEWKKSTPDFANLFLNTGAHFQHHYMFNSSAYKGGYNNPEWYCPKDQDPLFEILELYDRILGKLLKLDVRLIVATGLHQKPHEKLTFYWRIKEHADFLKKIGVTNYSNVVPRMSRDFLIEFNSSEEAKEGEKVLSKYINANGDERIFEIDNRGKSLFVELIFSSDIDDDFSIKGDIIVNNFKKYIAFVAIKNGEHDGIGYVVDTENRIKDKSISLKELYSYLVEDYV